MNDVDVGTLLSSHRWEDRLRAAELLHRCADPSAVVMLRALLEDDDGAVIGAAAPALLACGEGGWTAALEGVWNSDDTAQTEAIRGAFIDLVLQDQDVETVLSDHVARPRSDAAARGANEMLIALKLRPAAD
ncbi:HEAT repeat domain-containing protein [Auraticoccus cholistanensis]|uniref:HEAT repeat domain-containing protein n=1 Tax=Auraticoccus cholistanensis TaxID=2656650 RepID=UPI0012E78631